MAYHLVCFSICCSRSSCHGWRVTFYRKVIRHIVRDIKWADYGIGVHSRSMTLRDKSRVSPSFWTCRRERAPSVWRALERIAVHSTIHLIILYWKLLNSNHQPFTAGGSAIVLGKSTCASSRLSYICQYLQIYSNISLNSIDVQDTHLYSVFFSPLSSAISPYNNRAHNDKSIYFDCHLFVVIPAGCIGCRILVTVFDNNWFRQRSNRFF